MAGRKIKLKDQLGRVISVPVATPPAAPVTPPVTQPETPRPTATVWKLIREIPANIQKLAKLVGTGFPTRGPDGEWFQRQIEAGEGIDVADGDGVAGNPSVGLAELTDSGGGTLQKTLRDDYGRLAGTSEATTSDLAEGGNLYYTNARADARAAVAIAAHVAAADPHSQYFPKPSGTTAQLVRGNGSVSNALTGPISVTTTSDAVVGSGLTIVGFTSGSATVGAAANGRMTLTNTQSTDTLIDIDPQPGTNSATSQFRFFRNTNTTGSARFTVYLGDGSASNNAVIAGKGANSYVCANNGNFGVGTAAAVGAKLVVAGDYAPSTDNTFSSGTASLRHSVVWAGTGTISISDAREKTSVRPFTAAELAAAAELGREIGVYQWLAMIAEKGDAARQHIGMTVQGAIAVLESHGLDPFAYGFICYDQWDELPEIRDEWEALPQVVDDFGNVVQEALEAGFEIVQEHRPAGDRYSFRMDELLAFIARGLAHRLDAMEQRLAVHLLG
ncbi:tail fiber domain-containing protein [Stenotrophomonas sp.]|uniref:tail fiber domain-containing protein n=1 Tax=Stenotrophomonas sp. TaxID=69392 RepID=UPI0028AD426E|nr:tail fiber domain-containing protein [Stenotrophomonas sp.]